MDFTILHFAIHIVWRANVICTCRKSGIARKTTVAYPELRFLASFNAAKDIVDNAVDGICNAITRAHQTPVKVDFTDESKSYLVAAHKKLIENENVLFKNHEAKVDSNLKALGCKVEKAMNGYRGVFVDKKTFNIYFWLFIVIMEIALCSSILLICYAIKFGWL